MESRYHNYNYFVSATYSPEHLPKDMSLSKTIARKWVKRLSYFAGHTPVHFGCGEYGDESALPHYHLVVFGDQDLFEAIRQSWTYGRIEISRLCPERCRYVAGYTVKKMTDEEDPRLEGRTPEFWFGSRRPAIGYSFYRDLLDSMINDEDVFDAMISHVYPPYSIRLGGKYVRLPRYVRDKLRPIYRFYNEKKQYEYQKAQSAKAWAILKTIAANVQSVSLKWSDIKLDTMKERMERESNFVRAYELRKRRIL